MTEHGAEALRVDVGRRVDTLKVAPPAAGTRTTGVGRPRVHRLHWDAVTGAAPSRRAMRVAVLAALALVGVAGCGGAHGTHTATVVTSIPGRTTLRRVRAVGKISAARSAAYCEDTMTRSPSAAADSKLVRRDRPVPSPGIDVTTGHFNLRQAPSAAHAAPRERA